MSTNSAPSVESDSLTEFAQIMTTAQSLGVRPIAGNFQARLNLDPEKVKNGMGQLVLTLVKLLHELLERQAIRRIEGGSLTEQQVENVGLTLMRQAEEIDRLRLEFGLDEEDLNLDLGPLGKMF
jgi:hypothetical protein